MAFAIEMFFDKDSEEKIYEMCRSFKRKGINSLLDASDSKPHITLGIFNNFDMDKVEERIVQFSKSLSPFRLILGSIGTFPGKEGVLFLAPTVTNELLSIHDKFNNLFTEYQNEMWKYYQPGYWVPHCTLAINLSRKELQTAMDCILDSYTPKCITINELGVVEFYPVKLIKSYCI